VNVKVVLKILDARSIVAVIVITNESATDLGLPTAYANCEIAVEIGAGKTPVSIIRRSGADELGFHMCPIECSINPRSKQSRY
jgi:molybdopterin-binding protein